MAELLVNQYFQPDYIKDLSERIADLESSFDPKYFLSLIHDDTWESKALKERMNRISWVLHETLPNNYSKALDILTEVAIHYNGFDGMIFPDFVEQFGTDHWQESIEALELFTQYSSGEFAIRPFILNNTARTMQKMESWSTHENLHVRRLSSEGCRPRLPRGTSGGRVC